MSQQDVRSRRMARVITDPDCTGDLLAIATVLIAWIDFGVRGEPGKAITLKDVQERAFGDPPSMVDPKKWKFWQSVQAIRNDARTYRMPALDRETCQAPVKRRGGQTKPCGARSYQRTVLIDVSTGESSPLASCKGHDAWFKQEWDQNRHERAAAESVPLPNANHGGVLARHFPEIDWPKLWAQIDPHWVEHPESEPWAKPTLTVVIGGGQEDAVRADRRFSLIGTDR